MNNYIIFLFLSITSIFLIKKLYDKNESFKMKDKLERIKQLDFELKQKKMKDKDKTNLRNIKDDSSLFSQFCNKIKYFDDNYDPSSKLKMFTRYSKQNTIHKLNKKQNKLLNEVFDLQEKIYYNTGDIENHKKYEALIDNKTKQYIRVIDKAIANLKKNLNSKLILNINK
jgi:hypothetical protein